MTEPIRTPPDFNPIAMALPPPAALQGLIARVHLVRQRLEGKRPDLARDAGRIVLALEKLKAEVGGL